MKLFFDFLEVTRFLNIFELETMKHEYRKRKSTSGAQALLQFAQMHIGSSNATGTILNANEPQALKHYYNANLVANFAFLPALGHLRSITCFWSFVGRTRNAREV